jgi:hypothetical protein
MHHSKTIDGFLELGNQLGNISNTKFQELAERAFVENRWFDKKSVQNAIDGIVHMISEQQIQIWRKKYDFTHENKKNVGVIMAGNIPLVGFHDLFMILASGNIASIKLSSQDSVLMKFILESLIQINSDFKKTINVVDRIKNVDAVIATGSDNTARYFEYYFSKIPRIIRKNRTSIAVLDGSENPDQIKNLGHDIYDYYGLGCRNISKILVPEGFEMRFLLDNLQSFEVLLENSKYKNNYDYHKSILLVNREDHLDTGFSLFKKSSDFVSPTSVTYYEEYSNMDFVTDYILQNQQKIQCISTEIPINNSVKLGETQRPNLWDYADNSDTMEFLLSL